MRYYLIASIALTCAFSSCNQGPSSSNKDSVEIKIDSLEAIVYADESTQTDARAGMQLIREYAKYYKLHSSDSLAIDRLFKAGEISMDVNQGNLAVKYFRTISDDHSAFHKAPEALFLSGFCEENLNKDTAQARFFYNSFIQTFPNHSLAKDAEFSIQNMGKSDLDLIRMFEKNLEAQK